MGLSSYILSAAFKDIVEEVYIPKFEELFRTRFAPEILASPPPSLDMMSRSFTESAGRFFLAIDPTSDGSWSKPAGTYTKVLYQWLLNAVKALSPGSLDSHFLLPAGSTLVASFLGTTIDALKGALETYHASVKFLEGNERSFSYFKNATDFIAFVNSDKVKSLEGARAGKESETLYEDETYKIVVPRSYFASVYYGKGTDWCTAREYDTNYYNQYTKAGVLFMILHKSDQAKSYQLFSPNKIGAGPQPMCANAGDEFANIALALSKYPKVLAALKKYASEAYEASIRLWADEIRDGSRSVERYDAADEKPYGVGAKDFIGSIEPSITATNFGESSPGIDLPGKELALYAQVNEIDSGEEVWSDVMTLGLYKINRSFLSSSCLEFKEVNFATPGLLVDFQTRIASFDTLQDTVREEGGDRARENDGDFHFDRLDFSRVLFDLIREDILPEGKFGYAIFVNSVTSVEEDECNDFLSYVANGIFRGFEGIVEGNWTVKGSFNDDVVIAYDEEFGDLSDALADPSFKAFVEGGFYSDEDAKREGQQEFRFQALSAPSQAPKGIVAPLGVVNLGRYRDAVLDFKNRQKKRKADS